jgi:hypothetical protein
MSLNGVKSPGILKDYLIKEVNHTSGSEMGPYVNYRTIYEVYKNFSNDEHLKIMATELNHRRNTFIDDSTDFFDIFQKRVVTKTTDAEYLVVDLELPDQSGEGIEIVRVDCPDDKGRVGRAKTPFWMTVKSPNLGMKNHYQIDRCPGITLRVVSRKPMPDGRRGWKYKFVIFGNPNDYIKKDQLKNAELIPAGAPIEEGAITRGTVHLRNRMGKAFARYKFPFHRHAFEVLISDEAWLAGTCYVAKMKDGCCNEKNMPMQKMRFLDFESEFHFGAMAQMERVMLTGSSPSPGFDGDFTDPTTHRPIRRGAGVSFLDLLKGSGMEDYDLNNFNIDELLGPITRKIHKSKRTAKEKGSVVVDVITGTAGYIHVLLPELERKDPGCTGCDGVYMDEEAFSKYKQGKSIAGRQYTSIALDPYGKVKFHISDMLDSGVLSGGQEWAGFPISSYWIIVMVGQATGMRETSSAVQIWINDKMEQRGVLAGSWTPEGPLLKSTPGRWGSAGAIGNNYKIINEMMRAIFTPDFDDICILFPNVQRSIV